MQKLQTLGVAPVVTIASDLFLIHLLLMAFCTFVLVIVFCNISMLHPKPSTPFIQCLTSFRIHKCSTFLDKETCLRSGRPCHPMSTPLKLRGQKKIRFALSISISV